VRSRRLTEAEYESLVAGARVVERDAHGVKVWRLPEARMLKLFRTKRLLSSARIRPYHRRFAANAKRLSRIGIPVPQVEALYHIPHLSRYAVQYRMLPGRPLSAVFEGDDILGTVERLAVFMAELHEKGVYFRSVHPGNVLLCDDGRLGLIDLQDIRFKRGPLSDARRVRNFRHLYGGGGHGRKLRALGLEPLLRSYLEAVAWDARRKAVFRRRAQSSRALQALLENETS